MRKYVIEEIDAIGNVVKRVEVDSAHAALNKWLSFSVKNPYRVCIRCGSKEDCIRIYNNFLERTVGIYREYWVLRKLPYSFYEIERGCFDCLIGKGDLRYFDGTIDCYGIVPLFGYR